MTIVVSKRFSRDQQTLPQAVQRKLIRQLRLLVQNTAHPSLHVKKMTGVADIWEARIDRQYRITFTWKGDMLQLRRVGTHAIYDKP
jgi:mRNA-degrading endonuclease YafQ of YafQ-DinJ toxin-antitoxin module